MDKLKEFFKQLGASSTSTSREDDSGRTIFDIELPGRESQIFVISPERDVWTKSMAENSSVYLGKLDVVFNKLQQFALTQTKNAMRDRSKAKLSRLASMLFIGFEQNIRTSLRIDTGHGRIYGAPVSEYSISN